MTTWRRSGELHHASSLGNIASSKSHVNFRSYDSEDENMGRFRTHSTLPRTSVYSKGDIREQYCLSDRQLSSIEQPRRERFFGCLSGRSAPQSFLGVCVGRRAPSDENLTDYAPVYKHPRYPPPGSASNLFGYEDETESSYFRRKPTSFLCSNGSGGVGSFLDRRGNNERLSTQSIDPKRYTWLATEDDEDAERLEGPRSICGDINVVGPYIVGSPRYPSIKPQAYLSQSSEHLNRSHRCPAHTRPHPSLGNPEGTSSLNDQQSAPRIKHVSFARSHTLTSFDDATATKHVHYAQVDQVRPHPPQMIQPLITTSHHPLVNVGANPLQQQQQLAMVVPSVLAISNRPHLNRLNTPTRSQERLIGGKKPTITIQPTTATAAQLLFQQPTPQFANHKGTPVVSMHHHQHQLPIPPPHDFLVMDKIKRNVMKTQATQTELKQQQQQLLTLSPRTSQRIKCVVQGTPNQSVLVNGRKLTKSLSEAANRANDITNIVNGENDMSCLHFNNNNATNDHEQLHRTFSEEPPRSPFEMGTHVGTHVHMSRTSSRQSNFTETSRSDMTHSRNPSAESGTSFRSTDLSSSKCDSVISFKPTTEFFSDFPDIERPYYDTHSLPRKSCIHHQQRSEQPLQYHSYSLPRRESSPKPICKHNQAKSSTHINSENVHHFMGDNVEGESFEQYPSTAKNLPNHRRMSHSVVTRSNRHILPRRNSVHQSSYHRPSFEDSQSSRCVPSLTTSTISPPQEEKEIFIDFKPHLSPPSPMGRKRGLLKTRSEGEILIDRRRGSIIDVIGPTSQSDEDLLKSGNLKLDIEIDEERFRYQCMPIKDEGIFGEQPFFMLRNHQNQQEQQSLFEEAGLRERFRKRSTSLDDHCSEGITPKSWGDSPEHFDAKAGIVPPSSLFMKATKEQSESQPQQQQQLKAALLHQHQESISLDIDGDNVHDCRNMSSSSAGTSVVRPFQPKSSVAYSAASTQIVMATKWLDQPVAPGNIRSSIAVADNSVDRDDSSKSLRNSGKAVVLASHLTRTPTIEILGSNNNTDISECSTNTEDYVTCTDNSKRVALQGIKPGGPTTTTMAPKVPVSSTSASYRSTVPTVDGSSFESASSVYGLPINLDATATKPLIATATSSSVDEGGEVGPVVATNKLSKRILTKPQTPSRSRSSSSSSSAPSSGTYNNINANNPSSKDLHAGLKGSPSRTNVVTPIMVKQHHVAKLASVSDDEDKTETGILVRGSIAAGRRSMGKIDWNEDERRRRRGNLKLEFDIEAISGPNTPDGKSVRGVLGGTAECVVGGGKTMASPKTKISTTFKKISPDDRMALNILDGASPSKTKRFRPKTRRSPRNRSTSGGDELTTSTNRRLKADFSKTPTPNTPMPISPNNLITTNAVTVTHVNLQPSKPSFDHKLSVVVATASKQPHHSSSTLLYKKLRTASGKELTVKAISTESLRSVSPGSDSVFYSEADLALEHQVQCHHCGKDVDIVTAGLDTIAPLTRDQSEPERPEIVQPPAGFADSPNGVSKPARLYKKVDKRFRSEERHGDRRNHRNRTDTRAKSEERIKEDNANRGSCAGIRPAGSSPCMVLEEVQIREKFGQQAADPEQGIYHGLYRLGVWICIANQDVFRRQDSEPDRPHDHSERRGSTDSEKDFRKRYQALTHRLVHRRSCIEMYKRQSGNTFTTDKTVVVSRESGEFGFRIHGSKPVVVSAIEPDTPAESSGLEVGDIVLSVNGTPVIDKSHSEVVKIAHAGSDTLQLDVARTIDLLHPNQYDSTALYSGYLWRPCGYASGNPNTSKKWVQRWFSLRPDHCLYFYKSELESQPVGAILLTNHIVERCGEEVTRSFAFKIDDNENPILYLASDSEEATNRWVAILCHAAKQMDPWLELSTKNLRLSPSDVPRPDCFGYLLKLGNRWRSWSKRYCVLKDACLYFYDDGNSRNAFGMTCLQGYRVQPSNNYGGKKFAFEISPPEPKLRNYYFATESEMDKKRWIAALEYSIDRWMKAG